MNKNSLSKIAWIFPFVFIILAGTLLFPVTSIAKEKQTIAILPFDMISPEDITYIQSGILRMLDSRLSWKDHVEVVDKKVLLPYLEPGNTQNKNKWLQRIAEGTHSDYVLTGSITQFANAFSIDARIVDIKKRQYLLFSEQSKKIDDIIPKLNSIAAKINIKVFERKTIVFEKLAKEEKGKAEQWKKQNPEKLLPTIPGGIQEEKPPFWKFWEYF